jgi:hypothetical protein
MAINPVEFYQQVLSMSIEERSSGYKDLVSNNNVFMALINRKNLWESYSGPRIRQTLQIDKAEMQWFSGYDFLNNPPLELFNDAYYTPNWAVVPISLTMEEIWNNSGPNQIRPVVRSYMEAAERALQDGMEVGVFSDGTASGGKQIGGLDLAVPIVDDTGVYGGISRADFAIWRTTTYDADSDFPSIGTQVNSVTVRPIYEQIMMNHTRGNKAPDLVLASQQHYAAYSAATVAIQRIQRTGGVGDMGFTSLEFIGGGHRAEIVLGGGIRSSMPANTTFFLDTDSFRMRYNPEFYFDKLFKGDGQMPINQAAIAQFIGFGGELTMVNPLMNARLIDSDTAS